MLKREFKIYLRSFLIWSLITVGLFLLVFLIYPSILESDNIKLMDEYVKMFPEEMIKAFNLDISSMDTMFGWLKSEGFIFILLIIGVYSSIIGSNILLKEESDKTIEYLNSLPIKRSSILFKKIIVDVIYILLFVFVIGLFNYIGLKFSGDFDKKQYILLSITPLFSSLPLFAINLFISTFSHKTKKTLGYSLGIVFVSYFLQILSGLSDVTEFFKYFTVFSLSDVRNVIINIGINPIMIILSILISILFIICSFVRYENKELL